MIRRLRLSILCACLLAATAFAQQPVNVANTPSVGQSGTWNVDLTDGTHVMTAAMSAWNTAPTGTYVMGVNADLFINGTASAQAASGVQKVGIVGNAGAAVDQAPGSATPANAVQIAGTDGINTIVPFIDPCQRGGKTYININQTANTQLLTGVSSKHWYICSILIPEVGTAQNIALVEGTGTTCGTSTVAVPGVTGGSGTAATGANLAANQGFAFGVGNSAIGQTATAADNVCLYQSGSAQISGGLTAVDY
jgi:hypothetical protein